MVCLAEIMIFRSWVIDIELNSQANKGTNISIKLIENAVFPLSVYMSLWAHLNLAGMNFWILIARSSTGKFRRCEPTDAFVKKIREGMPSHGLKY